MLRARGIAPLAFFFLCFAATDARAQEGRVVEHDFTSDTRRQEAQVHDLDPTTRGVAAPKDTSLDYLGIGFQLALMGGYHHAVGYGVEASYLHYASGKLFSIGWGPVVQVAAYDGKYFRGAIAGEVVAGPAGLEAGIGFRQGDDTYASTLQTYTGQFLSVGYFTLGLREAVPIVTFPGGAASFGFESGFVLTFKVPVAVRGQEPSGAVPSLSGPAW